MPAKPKRIRKIEYDRIDRVGDGAQPGAHVTLVKARGERARLRKLVDPASIDARVQRVRDEFRERYSSDYGCCSPCSGYVYVDAVYDGMVIACDSDGSYWQFSYTQDASGDVEFGAPEAVKPSVKWSADSSEDDAPPMPVMKSKPLWSASVAERVQRRKAPIQKEQSMPEALDLSALDEATRTAVESAIAEREALVTDKAAFEAAVAAASTVEPEPTVVEDDDENLESIEGIQAAIAKSRSPEMKRVLKATLSRLQKAETQAAADREVSTRLMKAERIRIFKERAGAVPRVAAHAEGVEGLAAILADVDEKCGADACERLEKALKKADVQIGELVRPLLKSVGRNGGDQAGEAMILGTGDDKDAAIGERVAELRKAKPDLTPAQAMARVLHDNPELYAEAIAR